MKIFFDCEFHDTGSVIDLISIGLVREDGEEFYAIADFDERTIRRDSDWLVENVLCHIPADMPRYPQRHIGGMIESWLWDVPKPEWWAYYGAYDFVALAQCFGPLVKFPNGWDRYYHDFQVMCAKADVEPRKMAIGEHHALADARWLKEVYEELGPWL